jgi:hypothetical protein
MLRASTLVCAVLGALLWSVASGEAGIARASAGPSVELCQLVSPSGTNTTENGNLDAASAQDTLDALNKAAKQSLPRSVKAAIKKLIPLYRALASRTASKALDNVASYATKHCDSGTDAAGGGTTGSATNPGEGLDVCALVPLEDAEVLAGTPLNAGTAGNPINPSCTYTGPTTGPTAQVEVYVGNGAQKILDIDRGLNHALTAVPGLGDEAYAEDNNIFVRDAKLWIAIRLVRLNSPAENAQPLEALARKVVARL